MASELVNVSDLGMKEEELFSRCDSNIDSEKITAPRYSYCCLLYTSDAADEL